VAAATAAPQSGEAAPAGSPQDGQPGEGERRFGKDKDREHHRHREGKRDQDRNRERRPQPGGPERDRNRGFQNKGPRDNANRDRGRREDFRRQPEVITAAPPKKQGLDPDSPFAALAALKANLDKRGQS